MPRTAPLATKVASAAAAIPRAVQYGVRHPKTSSSWGTTASARPAGASEMPPKTPCASGEPPDSRTSALPETKAIPVPTPTIARAATPSSGGRRGERERVTDAEDQQRHRPGARRAEAVAGLAAGNLHREVRDHHRGGQQADRGEPYAVRPRQLGRDAADVPEVPPARDTERTPGDDAATDARLRPQPRTSRRRLARADLAVVGQRP